MMSTLKKLPSWSYKFSPTWVAPTSASFEAWWSQREFLDRFCGGYGRSVIWDQSKRVMFSWTPSSVSVFFLEPDSVLGPVDGEVIRGRFLSLQISLKISALHY